MFHSRVLPCVSLLIILTGFTGCYGYRIAVPEPDPVTEYEGKTAHSFLWGLVQAPQYIVAEDCLSNMLDEVYVSYNFGYAFATVLTLGVWAPMDVQWRCAEKPSGTGEI